MKKALIFVFALMLLFICIGFVSGKTVTLSFADCECDCGYASFGYSERYPSSCAAHPTAHPTGCNELRGEIKDGSKMIGCCGGKPYFSYYGSGSVPEPPMLSDKIDFDLRCNSQEELSCEGGAQIMVDKDYGLPICCKDSGNCPAGVMSREEFESRLEGDKVDAFKLTPVTKKGDKDLDSLPNPFYVKKEVFEDRDVGKYALVGILENDVYGDEESFYCVLVEGAEDIYEDMFADVNLVERQDIEDIYKYPRDEEGPWYAFILSFITGKVTNGLSSSDEIEIVTENGNVKIYNNRFCEKIVEVRFLCPVNAEEPDADSDEEPVWVCTTDTDCPSHLSSCSSDGGLGICERRLKMFVLASELGFYDEDDLRELEDRPYGEVFSNEDNEQWNVMLSVVEDDETVSEKDLVSTQVYEKQAYRDYVDEQLIRIAIPCRTLRSGCSKGDCPPGQTCWPSAIGMGCGCLRPKHRDAWPPVW